MYRVYDKNEKPGDLAIQDFFTVEAAEAKIAQLEKQGRFAAYRTFAPQCIWGRHRGTPCQCQSEATWFEPGMASYGAVCDEHYEPEWMTRMVRREEMVRREGEKGGLSAASSPQPIVDFWFREVKNFKTH